MRIEFIDGPFKGKRANISRYALLITLKFEGRPFTYEWLGARPFDPEMIIRFRLFKKGRYAKYNRTYTESPI